MDATDRAFREARLRVSKMPVPSAEEIERKAKDFLGKFESSLDSLLGWAEAQADGLGGDRALTKSVRARIGQSAKKEIERHHLHLG